MMFSITVNQLAARFDDINGGNYQAEQEKRDMLQRINVEQNKRNCFIQVSEADLIRAIDAAHVLQRAGWPWNEAAYTVSVDVATGGDLDLYFA